MIVKLVEIYHYVALISSSHMSPETNKIIKCLLSQITFASKKRIKNI